MRLTSLLITVFLMSIQTARAGDGDFVIKPSNVSVNETIDRLSSALTAKGITIFVRVDHSAGAEKVGLKLPPSQLLIFGNPKLGTPLMQRKRTIGLDLPMKVLAWQDNKGRTWLAYTRPVVLKNRHAITGRDEVFKIMTKALEKLTSAAAR